MRKADLLALAERCEKAEGPDCELDAAMAFAVGWRLRSGEWRAPGGEWGAELPRFTASLDAALTLVPEGMTWRVEWNERRYSPGLEGMAAVPAPTAYAEEWSESRATTPALALCAAVIRARGGSDAKD